MKNQQTDQQINSTNAPADASVMNPPAPTGQPEDLFFRAEPPELETIADPPANNKQPGKPAPVTNQPGSTDDKTPVDMNKPGSPQQPAQPQLLKIGDIELAEEEWLEGAQERKRAKNNREFLATLTQKSQIVNAISNEDIKLLLPYVIGGKPLPKDFRDKVELPKSFKIRNQYDDGDVEIKTDQIPQEFIDKIKDQILREYMPELLESRTQLADYQEKEQQWGQQQEVMGNNFFREFMKRHPDCEVTIPQGQRVGDVVYAVSKDTNHPENDNAIRMLNIFQTLKATEGGDPDKVYTSLFGKQNLSDAQKQQILKNQQLGRGEIPGSTPGDIRNPNQKALDLDVDPNAGDWNKAMKF